jgi:hypothetical protein
MSIVRKRPILSLYAMKARDPTTAPRSYVPVTTPLMMAL